MHSVQIFLGRGGQSMGGEESGFLSKKVDQLHNQHSIPVKHFTAYSVLIITLYHN